MELFIVGDKMKKFNLYYNGKKLRSIKGIDDTSEGILHVIEKNYILSKFWWVHVLIFDIILGFIGSTYVENKLEPILSFDIEYKNIVPEKFLIDVNSEAITIRGVREYQINNKLIEVHPLAKKRIENKKRLVITISFSILAIIFAIILLTSLFN